MRNLLEKLDSKQLGWLGIPLIVILMVPILYLGEACVFDFYDQLDETILSYVFAARYPGVDVYEQMMSGVPAEGLKPSAIFFVLFYRILPVLPAFMLQYAVVITSAFYGMYGCVKKYTDSSIVAFLCGTAFAMLPSRPVYGLSVVGVPLCIWCLLVLKERMSKTKDTGRFKEICRILLPIMGIVFFALTSHLVLVGYALIIVLAMVWLIRFIVERKNEKHILCTVFILGIVYGLTNLDLILQLFAKTAYTSHREESIDLGVSFWDSVFKMLIEGGSMHTRSYHIFIYLPFIIATIILVLREKDEENKKYAKYIIATLIFMVINIVQYSILRSEAVSEIKQQMSGMIKSFQFERFCWLMPAAWYILLGLSLATIWKNIEKKNHILALSVVVLLYMPTIFYIVRNSTFYQNINQICQENESGNMSWENLYSEDVMEEIELHIGRDMSEYRVASLGMCPVVPLMHGFYTIDGYSNNYPLEYKLEFREIIEEDISLNYSIKEYYDYWGSRAYLFHSEWGTYYLFSKKANAKVENLHINFDKMREMDCEYLFSAVEITDAEDYGLELEGSFESDSSWWKVWVYKL